MTVAFGAVTPTGAITAFTTTTPFAFNHTPSGTPRGVIVGIAHGSVSTDLITSVSYGGVAMTRVDSAVDTATEPGRSYLYFLGASVPTGTQSVSIVHTGSADSKVAVCATVTAASDTEVGDFDKIDNDITNPQVTLTTTDASLRFGMLYGGKASPTDYTAVTDVVAVASSPRIDFGANVAVFARQSSAASSGAMTFGYTSASSDDVAFVALAVQELVSGTPHTYTVQSVVVSNLTD